MAPTFPIYLDYHATTPVDPRVLEAMLPYFTERFGNAASRSHKFGWDADAAVARARHQAAALIGAGDNEIVFTSGATESNNLAIKGVIQAHGNRPCHVITTAIEHKSVLDTCRGLNSQSHRITFLGVDHDGRVDPSDVARAVEPDTILVSVMAASNEVGSIQPLAEIGAITRDRGVLFHTNAAQAAGKIPLDVKTLGVDLLSFTAHKMYGPKGVGALYVRRRNPRVLLAPQIDGGGHERGMRSGTLNVPGIVGFGKAAELCKLEMVEDTARLLALRERLNKKLHDGLDEIYINGSMEHRLPHNLNISFAYVEGESLLMGINDVAVSSGSACTSASLEPSYVLKALGAGDDLAHSSIRFGLGRWSTVEEVDYVADKLVTVVTRLREMSPLYELAKEGVDLSTMQWVVH
jgi:cysteine desulfurase